MAARELNWDGNTTIKHASFKAALPSYVEENVVTLRDDTKEQ